MSYKVPGIKIVIDSRPGRQMLQDTMVKVSIDVVSLFDKGILHKKESVASAESSHHQSQVIVGREPTNCSIDELAYGSIIRVQSPLGLGLSPRKQLCLVLVVAGGHRTRQK